MFGVRAACRRAARWPTSSREKCLPSIGGSARVVRSSTGPSRFGRILSTSGPAWAAAASVATARATRHLFIECLLRAATVRRVARVELDYPDRSLTRLFAFDQPEQFFQSLVVNVVPPQLFQSAVRVVVCGAVGAARFHEDAAVLLGAEHARVAGAPSRQRERKGAPGTLRCMAREPPGVVHRELHLAGLLLCVVLVVLCVLD